MMFTLTHLIGQDASDEAARHCSLLMRLLPRDLVRQRIALIGRKPAALRVTPGIPVHRIAWTLGWSASWSWGLQRLPRSREESRHLYAWGADAVSAVMGWAARPATTLVVADPAEVTRTAKWYRSGHGQATSVKLVATSELIRRRLVEAGIAADAVEVIRPGVDFGAIRQANGSAVREELALEPAHKVLLTPGQPSLPGGQYIGMWAAALLARIWPEVHMIVPGRSREQERLRRFARDTNLESMFRFTGDRFAPAELIASSDMMICAATGDIPTDWLAWAMAGGVPIVGSALDAVAELIEDRHNGLLCRPGEPHTLAIRLREAFEDQREMARLADVARGQAFEVFAAQKCVDAHLERLVPEEIKRRSISAMPAGGFVTLE